jgi:outer membrane autotransporter protein
MALLASSALATLFYSMPAQAACDVAAAPNSVSCSANTTTTDTTNNDAASTSSSDRLQAFSAGGTVTGSVASGVTVGGYGLSIQTAEAGAGISFTNNGVINETSMSFTSLGSLGLMTTTGPITYNSAAGATISGISVASLMMTSQSNSATGAITAHVNGDITNTGSIGAGAGVLLQSHGPASILLDGTGNISGRTGVSVNTLNANSGSGSITIGGSGNIVYTDTGGYGIEIDHGANAGTVTVNRTGTITGPGSGAGNNVGIRISSDGTGGVFVTGVGAISNVRFGIYGTGSDNFSITPGAAITAAVGAILVQTSGSGTIDVASAFDVTSTGGVAIATGNFAGGVQTVTVTSGTVSGKSSAVSMYSSGSGNLAFNMSGGTVLSSQDFGIAGVDLAQQGSGSSVVNQTGGSIGLAGTPIAGKGVHAEASGAGIVDIATTSVYATGTAVEGVANGTGTVHVATSGTARSTGGAAVETSSASGTNTIVNSGSLAGGGSSGIVRATSGGGAIAVTNAAGGSIASTLAAPQSQLAIFTSGGASTIVNDGSLGGLMTLANAANAVTNNGTWSTAGTNSFGSGVSTLLNAGTLNAGNGTVFDGGSLTFNNTGTFAPSGTVTVNGNMNLGGVYRIGLRFNGADRTVVSGAASLTGGLVQATQFGSGFTVGTSYNILTAAGGLGGTTFAGLTIAGTIKGHLGYDANNAYIVVDQAAIADALVNGTVNQRNVAGAIDAALNGGAAAGGFAPVLSLTGAALGRTLDRLSGEVATGATTAAFQSMNGFASLLTGSVYDAFNSRGWTAVPSSYAPERPLSPTVAAAYAAVTPADATHERASTLGQRWGAWGAAYGGSSKVNGEGVVLGSHNVSPATYGVAAGADYRVSPDTVLGFAAAGGVANWGLSDGLGSGRGDVFQLGAYGMHMAGPAYISGALAYAWHGMSTDRTVTVTGFDRLTAGFDAHGFTGRIEGGYRLATGVAGVTPYAALQAQVLHTPAYAENVASGTSTFALSYGARDVGTVRTELGARFDQTITVDANATLVLRSQAAWVHDTNTDRSATALFQTLPGSAFTVYGAALPKDAALLRGGADLRLANNVTLGARVSGELAAGARSIAGQASLRYAW